MSIANRDVKQDYIKHDAIYDAEIDDITCAMLSTMKCAMQRTMTLRVRY